MNFTIDLSSLPEVLRDALTAYLEAKPDWPIERVLCASLSLHLMQNDASNDRGLNRLYIDAMLKGSQWHTQSQVLTSTTEGHSH